MGRFLYFIFSPDGGLTLLACGSLWLSRRSTSRAARTCVAALAGFYVVASVYAVPSAVATLWSYGYHPFTQADRPRDGESALVVLGGSDEVVVGWDDRWSILQGTVAARVLEARRVFRIADPKWVIASGGATSAPGSVSGGESMREALVSLGVPRARVLVEAVSHDTHDEAVVLAPMLTSLHVTGVILVTSDVHMRRSVGAFKAAGWTAIPAIAPQALVPTRWLQWVHPSAMGLGFSRDLSHEVVGLPYYAARGWWRP